MKTKTKEHLKRILNRNPSEREVENAMFDPNIKTMVLQERMDDFEKRLKALERVV